MKKIAIYQTPDSLLGFVSPLVGPPPPLLGRETHPKGIRPQKPPLGAKVGGATGTNPGGDVFWF